jgi:cytochrome P450
MTTTEPTTTGWEELQYDHRDSRVVYSPYDLWKRLRAQCPVIHSDKYGGFWFVSRYDDVRRVLREWENFTATEGINIPRQNATMLPGEVDPPLHKKYRDLINPLLSRDVVAKHETWVRELAREWFAKIQDGVTFDACHDACEPFAKRVSLRVIGYDEGDLDKLDRWTTILSAGVRDDDEGVQASAEFFNHISETLVKRAEAGPAGDVISAVAFGEIDGRRLSAEDQVSMLIEITFGGLHTTGAVLAGALVWLGGHPEDRIRLRTEPHLMPTAIEEFVRHITPVPHMSRSTAQDVVLSGCPIPKGEKIMFGLGSANRDETRFENPDDVVLDRSPNPHLGFGFGPHRCVGSNLGTLGVRVGLEEFLSTFPRFAVTDYYALRWNGGEGRGLIHAPMVAYRT